MTDAISLPADCACRELCVYTSWEDLIVEIGDGSEVLAEYVLVRSDAVKLRDYLTKVL